MPVVRLFAAARAAAGVSQVEVAAESVAQALIEVVALYPGLERVLPQCSLLVDEVACRDQAQPVGDATVIDVLPPFAGG